MIKLWHSYKHRKPKEDGDYLCIVPILSLYDNDKNTFTIKQLYYNTRMDKWIDKSRLSVFSGYVVYKCCRAPIDENRVYSDALCEREDVMYWKKLPKVKKL